MSAVAHTSLHVRPAAFLPVAAVVVLAVVLAVVLLLAPWRAVAPAASTSTLAPVTPVAVGGGPVADCPQLGVSAC